MILQRLNAREIRVWLAIISGSPMKAIAADLDIGLDTARATRRNLKQKLGLRMGRTGEASTTDLVRVASQHGII